MALLSVVTTHPRNWLFSHPWEMGLLANTLLHGQGYSSPFGVPTGPTAFIAPGYPTLIAGVFLVFGSDTFAAALAIMLMHIPGLEGMPRRIYTYEADRGWMMLNLSLIHI